MPPSERLTMATAQAGKVLNTDPGGDGGFRARSIRAHILDVTPHCPLRPHLAGHLNAYMPRICGAMNCLVCLISRRGSFIPPTLCNQLMDSLLFISLDRIVHNVKIGPLVRDT